MKKIGIGILCVFTVFLLIAGGCYLYFIQRMYPYRETVQNYESPLLLDERLSGKQAREDLTYLYEHLSDYHPAWLDGSKNLTDAVKEQYQLELDTIGDEATVLQLWQAASRITNQMGDGHTGVTYPEANTLYLNDFTQLMEYGNPVAVNGIMTDQIYKTYLQLISYEQESYAKALFQNIFYTKSNLEYCGVDTSNGVCYTFLVDGKEKEFYYDFVDFAQVKTDEMNSSENEGNTSFVTYQIDKDHDVAIFKLLSCVCNDEYLSVLDQFFTEVFEQQINHVIVDLCDNGGGNSWVANEFLRYIDVDEYASWDSAVRYGWYLYKNKNVRYQNEKKPQVFSGDIYVLTNIFTYSSAMDFAMLIRDNHLGIIIGETSGNLPDSYGDILDFQMPNSKLAVSISFKRWYRLDQSKSGQPLTPDIEVEDNKALEKAYEEIEHKKE